MSRIAGEISTRRKFYVEAKRTRTSDRNWIDMTETTLYTGGPAISILNSNRHSLRDTRIQKAQPNFHN